MNEITNVATGAAADIAAQVAEGSVELVPTSGTKGKVITGAIAATAVAGAGIGGWFLGRRHERKKFEDRIADIEEYLAGGDDFEEEDDEETEEESEESVETEKKPKAEGKKEK